MTRERLYLFDTTLRDGAQTTGVHFSLEDKRRVIQLLLESEKRYRDLVETSHDLIWTTDAQGRFTYLNAAANSIFGLAAKDLIGRCFFDFEAGTSHISNRRFLATLRRSGEVKSGRSISASSRPITQNR